MQQRLTQKSRGGEHKKHCERYRAGKPAAILGAVGAGEREKERDRKKGIDDRSEREDEPQILCQAAHSLISEVVSMLPSERTDEPQDRSSTTRPWDIAGFESR